MPLLIPGDNLTSPRDEHLYIDDTREESREMQSSVVFDPTQLRMMPSTRLRGLASSAGAFNEPSSGLGTDQSAMLLTRTFSVGASIHQMKSMKNVEIEQPIADGEGVTQGAHGGLPRTTSSTTILEDSEEIDGKEIADRMEE